MQTAFKHKTNHQQLFVDIVRISIFTFNKTSDLLSIREQTQIFHKFLLLSVFDSCFQTFLFLTFIRKFKEFFVAFFLLLYSYFREACPLFGNRCMGNISSILFSHTIAIRRETGTGTNTVLDRIGFALGLASIHEFGVSYTVCLSRPYYLSLLCDYC